MATRKWGDEKLVNTSTLNHQETSDVAVLTNGTYVVVWADDDHSGSLPDAIIRGQRFDAAGNKLGAEISISVLASQTGNQTLPAVTALADGGFYVGWSDEDSTTDHDAVGAVFDVDGAFVREQHGNNTSSVDVEHVEVAQLGTGSIMVWTDKLSTSDHDVHFRIFDANGNSGSILVANTTTAASQDHPSVAVTPDQSIAAIVWDDSSDSTVKGRLFDATGGESAPQFVVAAAGGSLGVADPVVTWLSNDLFVVVWREINSFNAGDNEIRARIFDGQSSTVVALSGNIPVNSTITGSQESPAVVAMPNGGFAVVWEDVSGVDPDGDGAVRLQAFDGGGGKIGGEIVVNTTTDSSQFDPSIAVLPDGRLAVTWTDASSTGGDTSGAAVRMQIIDPRDGIVTGTPASETLYGHDLVNDEISAGAGNDTLFGLEGNDALYGGDGIDTLIGGFGGDHMFGGIGNDDAIIDSLLDRVFEEAAGGTDQVITPISYQLQAGSHVEVLKTDNVAATTPLNLTGNEFANTLQGNNGTNKLNGGLGNDTMQGLGGNDTYIVANSGDRVVEAANSGTDTILALLNHTLLAGSYVEVLKTINSAATTAINLISNEIKQRVEGNAGTNVLTGNGGNDTLQGLGGNDTLAAGTGNDTMTGGSGNDVFLFNTALSSVSNVDRVTDYNVAADTMRLENAVFTGLAAGTLSAAAFRIGAAAADASDRIIYNNATGAVSFDADGTGATAAIKFAQLAAGLAMTNADFFVV